jgi:ethanolamine utilization protein EutN
MFLGRIEGKVWATVKEKRLNGIQLYIMQPIDEYGNQQGNSMVVVDTIGADEGDIVYWVNSTEASFVLEDLLIPSEASVVGLVDDLNLDQSAYQEEH